MRSTALVSVLTLLSRILGMVRDILFAGIFGASRLSDAFFIAWTVPNMFRQIFGEGALTSAFIPVFVSRLTKDGKEKAQTVFNSVVTFTCLILVFLVVLIIGVSYVLQFVLPENENVGIILPLIRITAPYLILICITALLSAALNSFNHFMMPSLAPILMNVVFIATALYVTRFDDEEKKIYWVAYSVLVGGAIQLVVQIPPLKKFGMTYAPSVDRKSEDLKSILATFVPIALTLAVIQINEFSDNIIAQIMVPGEGAVSRLYYGNRLIQLPIALVGLAIATVAFPSFSRLWAQGDKKGFGASLSEAVGSCLFLVIPATAGLCLFSDEILELLFKRGKFTDYEVVRTTAVIFGYAGAIVFYSVNHTLNRALYSIGRSKEVMKIGLKTVLLNIALNITFVLWLQEAGIAAATSVTAAVNTVLLLRALKGEVEIEFALIFKTVGKALFMTAVSTAFAFVALKEVMNLGCTAIIYRALTPVAAAALVYCGTAATLRMRELRYFLKF